MTWLAHCPNCDSAHPSEEACPEYGPIPGSFGAVREGLEYKLGQLAAEGIDVSPEQARLQELQARMRARAGAGIARYFNSLGRSNGMSTRDDVPLYLMRVSESDAKSPTFAYRLGELIREWADTEGRARYGDAAVEAVFIHVQQQLLDISPLGPWPQAIEVPIDSTVLTPDQMTP